MRPSSRVVASLLRGEQVLFGVGVVGVADHEIRSERAIRSFDEERSFAAFDRGCRSVCIVGDAEFGAQFDDGVDDSADPTLGIPDTEVEIDVAHQIVQRGRVRRRPAEKDQRVLHDLLELWMVEVVLDVALHRSEQREPACLSCHIEVDEIPQPCAILVNEMLHPHLIVLA